MLFILFFVYLALGSELNLEDNDEIGLANAFQRVLIHAKDISPPTNDASLVQDPGQNKMVNYDGGTVFTRAHANQITNDAFAYFLSEYGLDYLGSGVHNPAAGTWTLGNSYVFTFINGIDYLYRLIFDSQNALVGITDKYFLVDVGYVAVVTAPGYYPGGVRFNKSMVPGDVLCYTQYNYLREQDRGKNIPNKIKDQITTKCDISFIRGNRDLLTEQFFKGFLTDKEGRHGYGTVNIVTDIENGIQYQRLRSILTFNHTD